ncbi:MAG: alpha/beta fold hydrolase [Paracoccaceae bacterium]
MTWTTRPRSEFGQLAAIRTGSGPRILLLHGVGLRAEAWNAQIDALAPTFEIIAPDMAGHGHSPMFADVVQLATYTDQLARGIEELDGPVMVIGHSMGAMIALDLACRYPHLIRGVVAMNAIYRRSQEAKDAVRDRWLSLDTKTPPDPTGPMQRWFGGLASPEAGACRDWLVSADPSHYRHAYLVFSTGDAPPDEDLANLTCPALFFTGADEPNSTPAMSDAMAALAPKGRAKILPDAAHMMPMTHPDTVNAVLADFLNTCTEES